MTEQLLGELHSLLNILLAVLLGFAIGYERKLRYKEAGIRTHTIVCVGSALIMVVSKYGFSDIQEYDASRVAAQIVSGIGFLGAGIIIYRKHEIHGLTTAAGVWATAGVGMAAGAGITGHLPGIRRAGRAVPAPQRRRPARPRGSKTDGP